MAWLTTFENDGSEMVLAVDLFDSGVELSKEGGYLIEEGNGKGIFLFGVVKLESGDVFVLGIES